jgi:hypothetical protein
MDKGELEDAWKKAEDKDVDLEDQQEIKVMLTVLKKHPDIYSTTGMNDIIDRQYVILIQILNFTL